MLRKLAIVMFATTMLAAPVLAADAVKPAAAAPKAQDAATTTPATPAGKDVKGNAPAAPDAKTANANGGAAPATEVKTIKADKHLKIVKVVTGPHRHHTRTWYMVHRFGHPGYTMTTRLSKPVKHVYVRRHQVTTHLVKAGKDLPNKDKATQ